MSEQAQTLYVVRAFCVGGERLEVDSEFAYDPKADRVLVAELRAAGKISANKPAALLQAEADAQAAADAAAAAQAAAEAEAAKAGKKG
jgi:hypothetical protein